MSTLDELTLIRGQYRYIRKTAINDFRNSSYVVPFTEDGTIPPGGTAGAQYRKLYSKGFGHTGPSGNIIVPIQGPYGVFLNGIKNNIQSDIYTTNNSRRRLADVYSIFDNDYFGPYLSSYTVPLAPLIGSFKAAAELLELYAMALVRDIPLTQINDSSVPIPILDNVILPNLNLPNVKNYLGAPVNGSGNITRELLFRGNAVGDTIGPYVSQLLFCDIQLGTFFLEQNSYLSGIKVDLSGTDINFENDFMTNVNSFIPIWNGVLTNPNISTLTRLLTTPRDCAYYINKDQLWQMFYMAATAILGRTVRWGYFCTPRQGGKFINLGVVDLYDLMGRAAKMSMNASWLWKWKQMRVRPEEMAYQLNYNLLVNPADPNNVTFASTLNPTNPSILKSVYDISGTYLLPQVYPYGSPFHASYPSGHATYGGALSTILKAFFNCDYYTDARQPSLIPPYGEFPGSAPLPPGFTGQYFLTLEGEINKLASNCADFRNMAGIHYRSDAESGLSIGEQVAIVVLQDAVKKYNSNLAFVFRKRNGEKVVIKNYDGPDPPPTPYLDYNYDPSGNLAFTIYSTQPYGLSPQDPNEILDQVFSAGVSPQLTNFDVLADPGIASNNINES
jgi:hypothetical protein